MKRIAMLLVMLIAAFGSSGCIPFWLFGDDDDDYPPPPPPVEQPPPDPSGDVSAPSIFDVEVPDWPPLGYQGSIQVGVTDDTALSRLEVDFREHLSVSLSGTSDNVLLYGSDLGEGFGQLELTAFDVAGWSATHWVDDLLVDLSPHEITLGELVIPASGELELGSPTPECSVASSCGPSTT
jgi:hypothetical protein